MDGFRHSAPIPGHGVFLSNQMCALLWTKTNLRELERELRDASPEAAAAFVTIAGAGVAWHKQMRSYADVTNSTSGAERGAESTYVNSTEAADYLGMGEHGVSKACR